MPVVVKTREYGEDFYREISPATEEGKAKEYAEELYG